MSKHTPGPWVRNTEAPKIIMSGSFIDGHQGYIVGSVTGNDNSGYFASEEEAEANARLIAAAPELLDICEGIIQLRDNAPEDLPAGFAFELIQKARAAIAKARGES